jgi:hypothetical protein
MADVILSESPFTDADPDVIWAISDIPIRASFFTREILSVVLNTQIAQYRDDPVAQEWLASVELRACIKKKTEKKNVKCNYRRRLDTFWFVPVNDRKTWHETSNIYSCGAAIINIYTTTDSIIITLLQQKQHISSYIFYAQVVLFLCVT